MFRFHDPYYLHALWFTVLLVAVLILSYRKVSRKLWASFSRDMLKVIARQTDWNRKKLKSVLQIIVIVLALIAWARPQLGIGTSEIKSEGVELMLALDVSNSMLAEDVKPNRLGQAKRELLRLVDTLGGDKIGLIAFAGSAVLISPLTQDKGAIKMFLEGLDQTSIQNQGTSFEKVLTEGGQAFNRGGVDTESDQTVKVTRALVIVSDGEDHSTEAIKLAQKIKEGGIHVFTLAVGTEGGEKIPLRDEFGNIAGYLKDPSGSEVVTKVKGDSLRKLSEEAEGSFYHLTYSGQEIAQLKGDLDRLKKAQFESVTAKEYDEKFQWFLMAAIGVAFLELLFSERSKKQKKWLGRFAGVLFFIFTSSQSEALGLNSIIENQRAIVAFNKEKFPLAYAHFVRSLGYDSFNPDLQFNVGVSLSTIKEEERSIQQYIALLRLKIPDELRFKAEFNLAQLYAASKKVELALYHYSEALKIQPFSTEVKTNIELLFKDSGQKGGEGEGDGKGGQGQQPQQKPQDKDKGDKPQAPKDLSDETVQKVLEELKRQEQQVRAKELDKKGQEENPDGKNW